MRCPFLREAQVKSCQASAFKKMIARNSDDGQEKCSSDDYLSCPAARQLHEDRPSHGRCPFLQESLVQYCSAASVTKFIPYSESLISRCGNEGHRYCDVFREFMEAGSTAHDTGDESIEVPENLSFAPNHLWLARTSDGSCHVGVDAFLVRAMGTIDRLSFLTAGGVDRPAVVVTTSGTELHLVFPNPMVIIRVNAYLRSHPERVTADPYGSGWLFEGTDRLSGKPRLEVEAGLIAGAEARGWMDCETGRVAEVIHRHLSEQGKPLMNDGGVFEKGCVRIFSHDELLRFVNEFFSPHVSWRK